MKRDGRLKLRKVWQTEQPQRLNSRAVFALCCVGLLVIGLLAIAIV